MKILTLKLSQLAGRPPRLGEAYADLVDQVDFTAADLVVVFDSGACKILKSLGRPHPIHKMAASEFGTWLSGNII